MYVLAGSPLPQNSLDGMPTRQQARMRQCVDGWNLAAALAKRNAYTYVSPDSGLQISQNLRADMASGQRDAKLAAYSILNNLPPQALEKSSMIGAPEVMPLNAAASAEYGCDWQKSIKPTVSVPAQRVFLQPAPNTPQVAAAVLPPPPPPQTSAPRPSQSETPAWSPCPPGVPFQGRYVAGAPVCGVAQFGAVSGGPGLPRAYASIVSGMGDSPSWSDAFGSYQPGQGTDFMGTLRDHPWIALLLAAGVGFGIMAIGKMR